MLEHLKDKIKNVNVDYIEIHVEEVEATNIIYSNDNLDKIGNSKTLSGNVRVFDKGRWGFTSFNHLNLDKQIENAILNAKLAPEKDKSIYRLAKGIVDEVSSPFEIDSRKVSLEEKNSLIKGYNDILKDPCIQNRRSIYKDYKTTIYYVNSEGSAIKQNRLFTGMASISTAKDGNLLQTGFHGVGTHGGFEIVKNQESKVEEAKKRSIDLLKAPQIEGKHYTVLLNPNLAGVFAHEAFGHIAEADSQYENPEMLKTMTLGARFGIDKLNIIDDGSLNHLAGYTPYDNEGIPARKNYLIKDGKLNSRLHSRFTAGIMHETATGNGRALTPAFQSIPRMTNTYIENGTQSFDELISQIDDGIYALDMLGGMTNLELFTFSSAYGYKVKNGKIDGLVRDIVLSGNVFETMHNITGIGNDLEHHGGLGGCGKAGQNGLPVSTGSPHLLVKNVLIGGK